MKKKAVLAAVTDYKPPTMDLEAAVGEAVRWKSLLQMQYGFAETDIRVIPDKLATRDSLLKVHLPWLFQDVQPGDEIVFGWNGHGTKVDRRTPTGVRREQALLMFHEADADRSPSAFTGSDLADAINNASVLAGVAFTVILDCCFSGGFDVPSGAKVLFEELLTNEELRENRATIDFEEAIDRRIESGMARPIIVAACGKNERAIQTPAVPPRFLFSELAIGALKAFPKHTYNSLMKKISPASVKPPQTPELLGDTTAAPHEFLSNGRRSPITSARSFATGPEENILMRTITVNIAGSCCFVDGTRSDPFVKRLVLPLDILALKGSERHIPFVEFPDANVTGGKENLSEPYTHANDEDGTLFRRFELLGHTVRIENIDTSGGLKVCTSFKAHVPKMTTILPILPARPRAECFTAVPDPSVITGFFDISAGELKAGTLYDFKTYFAKQDGVPVAELITPQFVVLRLPITSPELKVTISKEETSYEIILNSMADSITIGNELEMDISGPGSGDDVRRHFKLYYNLNPTGIPNDPPLPIKTGDPLNSCTVVNWP